MARAATPTGAILELVNRLSLVRERLGRWDRRQVEHRGPLRAAAVMDRASGRCAKHAFKLGRLLHLPEGRQLTDVREKVNIEVSFPSGQ
jgi:hypothetical protein